YQEGDKRATHNLLHFQGTLGLGEIDSFLLPCWLWTIVHELEAVIFYFIDYIHF
ncbi:hypothetical protein ACJX0J_040500, partial [Zea mays]